MKTHTKIIAWLLPLFALALFLSSPRPVNAQEAPPAAVSTVTTGSGHDLLATAPTLPAAIVTAPASASSPIGGILNYLAPIIALLVTGLANKYIPKIPNFFVPVIAASVGVGVNFINAYATGHPANIWLGLLAGAAATTLHQVGTHLSAGMGPSPTLD